MGKMEAPIRTSVGIQAAESQTENGSMGRPIREGMSMNIRTFMEKDKFPFCSGMVEHGKLSYFELPSAPHESTVRIVTHHVYARLTNLTGITSLEDIDTHFIGTGTTSKFYF